VRTSAPMTLTRLRLGGTAAILAGLCYGAAGYLDRPAISGFSSALVSVLSVAMPILFLGGCWAFTTDYYSHHKVPLRAKRGCYQAVSEPCWASSVRWD
jgi:hypothetical protein